MDQSIVNIVYWSKNSWSVISDRRNKCQLSNSRRFHLKQSSPPPPPKMSASILRKSVSIEKSTTDGQHQSRFQVAKVSDEQSCDNGIDSNGDTIRDMATSATHQSHNQSVDTNYDTRYAKSLRHYTREALPRVDNYRHILSVHRHMTRPTLDELHGTQTTIIHRDKVSHSSTKSTS